MLTPLDQQGRRFDVTRFAIADLAPFEGNPRRGDVSVIVESLQALGQYRPIVVNEGSKTGRPMEVLAGNHTMQAARQLGWDEIDCHLVDVDDETARRIVLVDNRANDKASYDDKDLLELLQALPDLEGTGWSPDEMEALTLGLTPTTDEEVTEDADDAPPIPPKPITRPGDVWQLGESLLVCGDATDPAVIERLTTGRLADVMWTDPPYGVEYVGKTKDSLTIENDGAAGLRALLDGAFSAGLAALRPGAPAYVAHSGSQRITFETSLLDAGYLVREVLVWVKNAFVLGRADYHYQHEPILVATTPEEETPEPGKTHEPILYGFAPGGDGRLGRGGPHWWGDHGQSTVIEVPRPNANRDHPTMKPVELILRMLRNSMRPGGVVFDPFAGSGSTLIAALHRHGSARLVELDPRYCDVIARRYQTFTGVLPTRDGEPHDFLAEVDDGSGSDGA